ncbi:MAG: DUF5908 family protein [Flavobacteriales bacterium]|jgi:hypothetical protein|nr:DUF5908 family protein [Flavobacteriales bacterium]
MPVEIKEITIRTEVRTSMSNGEGTVSEKELGQLKTQIVNECRKLISQNMNRKKHKR